MTHRARVLVGAAIGVAWVGTVAAAFIAGGVLGYQHGGELGFAVGSEQSREEGAVYQGIQAVDTLRHLPQLADTELRLILEEAVDHALVNYSPLMQRPRSHFDAWGVPLCADPMKLASYRALHPSPSNDPDRLQSIAEAVALITSSSIASRAHGNCRAVPAA